ncbi:TPA: LD-carboxypeptidase, partial [Streptococcus pneumoniae]|nr:LD-carboxypeptidase [Streptococcus pneumoniae]
FYGQSFLADICELDKEMLAYSLHYFKELIETGRISEIRPSDVWYEERTDFSPTALGTPRVSHANTGFELLRGNAQFEGKILGGCLESLYDIFDNSRYADSTELCQKYKLFPDLSDWEGKILLLETSEEKPELEDFKNMLRTLKDTGIFEVISGLLVGKPMDETFYDDYKEALLDIIDSNIPIIYNLNVGHATPRAIVPFGVHAYVDAKEQIIRFDYNKK